MKPLALSLLVLASTLSFGADRSPPREVRSFAELPESLREGLAGASFESSYNFLETDAARGFGLHENAASETPPAPAGALPSFMRLHGLDGFTRETLPALARQQGWDSIDLADISVARGSGYGYDYSLRLERVHASLPIAQGGGDRIEGAFGPDEQLLLDLKIPDARVTTVLKVDLVSQHWYLPDYRDEFNLRGERVSGDGWMKLRAAGGDLETVAHDFSRVRLEQVTAENLGLLKKLFDLIIGRLHLCDQGCDTLDGWLTHVANAQLHDFLAGETFQKTVRDALHDSLEALATSGWKLPGTGISTKLRLEGFRTAPELRSAVTRWSVALESTAPTPACALGLEEPVAGGEAARDESTPWLTPADLGDLHLALPRAGLDRLVYLLAREGGLCSETQAKVLGVPLRLATRPIERATFGFGPSGLLTLDLTLALDVTSEPRSFPSVRSESVRTHWQLAYRPELEGELLVLRQQRAVLTSIDGDLRVAGFRIPARRFARQLESAFRAQLQQRWSRVPLLERVQRLAPTWSIELLQPPALDSAGGEWLEAAFAWKARA